MTVWAKGVQIAKDWKAVAGAVAVVVAGWAWLDARLDAVQDAIAIVPVVNELRTELGDMGHRFERQGVAFNLFRCELQNVSPIDCDPYEGLDVGSIVPTHAPGER